MRETQDRFYICMPPIPDGADGWQVGDAIFSADDCKRMNDAADADEIRQCRETIAQMQNRIEEIINARQT